jgi:hypothetical protein
MIKWREIRLAGHVACVEEMLNAYTNLVVVRIFKRLLRKCRRKLGYNIKLKQR